MILPSKSIVFNTINFYPLSYKKRAIPISCSSPKFIFKEITPISNLKFFIKKLILLALLLRSFAGWSQNPIAYDLFDKPLKKAEVGNTIGAIEDYSKAIQIDPLFVSAYLNRTLLKQKLVNLKAL